MWFFSCIDKLKIGPSENIPPSPMQEWEITLHFASLIN